MKKPQAVLKHRLFVPKEYVTQEMKDAYVSEIPNYFEAYDDFGEERLDRTLYVHGWKYHKKLQKYSFSRGDIPKYKEVFRGFNIVDKTSDVMMKYDIKFIGVPVNGSFMPLYQEQKAAIKEITKCHYGILEAPPRFGKTTVMCKLITMYKRRTIIFVHQNELASQLISEFRKCTNITDIEKRVGRKLIGLAKTWADLENYEVAVVTWQKMHLHQKKAREYANDFGLTLVDEFHRFSSEFSSKVVERFNSRFRIAVTATPERKDNRHVIGEYICGPVTVKGIKKQVPLHVKIVPTGFAPTFQRWTTYMSKIAKSKTRNKLCLNAVEAEVKQGQYVLIVCTLVKHILELTASLRSRGIAAEAFYGGAKDRDGILRRAKSGATKVIVGMRSMLTGVNVPRWSSIHVFVPTANKPNHYQEFSRVRTISPGKKFALVSHYLDNCGAARGCYKTCHSNYINPEYGPISFVDKHGNILKRTPSLKQINEWSMLAGKNDDSGTGVEENSKRKPTGFVGGRATWGWSNHSQLKVHM